MDCLLCKGSLGVGFEVICQICWESMDFPLNLRRCSHCQRPVASTLGLCPDCASGSPFGRAWALGLHAGPLREAIHKLKFNGREDLGKPLGQRLGKAITEPFDYLVPVPLHAGRLRERGYNQAALVAHGIAAQLQVPVLERSLLRSRDTGHQAKLVRADRLVNLQGAFTPAEDLPPWYGKAVLLVDDVLTTGATAAAAASALLASGAVRVGTAVLAVSTTPVGSAGEVGSSSGNVKRRPK